MKLTNQPEKVELNPISGRNPYLAHFLKYPKAYLLLSLLVVLMLPLLINLVNGEPLLKGGESYFHLHNAASGIQPVPYNPWQTFLFLFPERFSFLLPVLLAIASVILFHELAERMAFSMKFTFFFLLFLILSPAFIFTFTTISNYSLFTFLLLLTFYLMSTNLRQAKYFSYLPFFATLFFDLFSAVLVFFSLLFYYLSTRDKVQRESSWRSSPLVAMIFLSVIIILFNAFVLRIPFFYGPFHLEHPIADLISDFGGLSGMGFFVLLLALIGLAVTWKRKGFYFAYLFIPLLLPAYVYGSQNIFPFTVLCTFFATVSFMNMFERSWTLDSLKKYTFLLLVLGIAFSSITYIDRITEMSPLMGDREALTWIKENTASDAIILSAPVGSHYIRYFGRREPFASTVGSTANQTSEIMSTLYIGDLFPLLEENNISIIYITAEMRQELPEEQGLLFLLKNERFKLVHSSEEAEVWMFSKKRED